MTQVTDFDKQLDLWLAAAQAISDDYMTSQFPMLRKPVLSLQRGAKYVRVVRTGTGGPNDRSVHCFVEIATGDVLKAESWKRPAKGARGSIYDADRPGVNAYGGLYKR